MPSAEGSEKPVSRVLLKKLHRVLLGLSSVKWLNLRNWAAPRAG